MDQHQAKLARALRPKSVAVVGLRDGSPFVPYFEPTFRSDAHVYFVNPKHDTVMGRPTVPTLSDVQGPIDVVFCVTSAPIAVTVVEEAARLDVGGVVLVSSGYAEAGPEGIELQRRLAAAAETSGMAIIGPNGLGYVNVPQRISLTIASDHRRRPGGISVVSQSGALLTGVALAAWDRSNIGLNTIISAGNEAATDLADYVDYFVDDPDTSAIGLVIEKIRRPEAFFAAARRALAAGKPIVALKLARSSRTQEMAASHTGALTGDAWVYDVAFEQLGIGIALDVEDLVDRLAILEQVEDKFRVPINGVGIVTSTGGYASLTMDLAVAEGIDVPALDDLKPWVEELIPGTRVPNPLDTTPMGLRHWEKILDRFSHSPEVDALVFVHPLADEDEGASGHRLLQQFVDAAERVGKPFVVSNCAGPLGSWAQEIVDASPAVASGRGPRATLRGLRTLGHYARSRHAVQAGHVEAADPPGAEPIAQPEGAMLPFAAAMNLLSEHGIPTAQFHLIEPGAEVTVPAFEGPYVVKLADVAHRTEHGAVELQVTAENLSASIDRMRAIAERDELSPLVAVQPMTQFRGEAFLGIHDSELGPMIVLGLGGVFVEVLKRISGRMAPITREQAEELIAEFEDLKVMHGFRGQPAWDLDNLADILVGAGCLADSARSWLASVDVNPLLVTAEGFVAVDALCLVKD